MKGQKHGRQKRFGMTLVELLLVTFIIAVLMALILPINPWRRREPGKMKARVETESIAVAVEAYESEYGCWPVANIATNEDVTFGINQAVIPNFKKVDETRLIATNSDLILVLMDFDLGINAGHKLNPKQIKFLNAKVVEDTNSSGVSVVDHQFRDPWGNPYIVTVDSTRDNQCSDFLYCQQKVSQNGSNRQMGFNGLFNPVETNGSGNHFYFHGKVMVWSAGPDKKFDLQTPAHIGVNKDNVLSWQ